jgi:hypothetical protein
LPQVVYEALLLDTFLPYPKENNSKNEKYHRNFLPGNCCTDII